MARATYTEIAEVISTSFPEHRVMLPSRNIEGDGMTVIAPETALADPHVKLFINEENSRIEVDHLTYRYFYDEEMDDADAIAVALVRAIDRADFELQEEMSERPW